MAAHATTRRLAPVWMVAPARWLAALAAGAAVAVAEMAIVAALPHLVDPAAAVHAAQTAVAATGQQFSDWLTSCGVGLLSPATRPSASPVWFGR